MTARTTMVSVAPIARFSLLALDLWTDAAARCRRLVVAFADPYRPEAHYMRGPGPKWHAKHGGAGARR